MSKNPHKLGRRYRVNMQGHVWDGRVGFLERTENTTGWIMRGDELRPVPLGCLTDNGVVHGVRDSVVSMGNSVRTFVPEVAGW